jgi:hypothetical protein
MMARQVTTDGSTVHKVGLYDTELEITRQGLGWLWGNVDSAGTAKLFLLSPSELRALRDVLNSLNLGE